MVSAVPELLCREGGSEVSGLVNRVLQGAILHCKDRNEWKSASSKLLVPLKHH